MGRVYDRVFDGVLVRMDAEEAHHRAFSALRAAGPLLTRVPPPATDPVTAMGLRFPNRLGLAPGFDKTAQVYDRMGAFGFGHVEIGTVTALAQPGNPLPRLFRLPQDRAIVNRMGFNNDGAVAVAARLAQRRRDGRGPVLGVNIGKSKVVPDDDQAGVEADYETSTRLLAPHADYLVVNVSSPNTPGLRNLQAVEKLAPLLEHVRRVADAATAQRRGTPVPLLVKIAPDLSDDDVLAVADMALALGLSGIIATNTTIARENLRTDAATVEACGAGGLSGAPLRERATEVVSLLRGRVGDRLTLIGVGGIGSAEDARQRIAAGADLVQAYSALIYGGPSWPRQVLKGLR
ncbi:quinone-dependent dihydroorotate dehydrogenase [Nocardioides sp. zg-536]|uniref:Dihydroorotate dehydrogenase (quinone) n=2 Tax=Nocardioides faecalis TaxID=2803858 RepID=A0A939BWY5_9ACTN|nr:quinone-dependent dihydroorotate dehydrogenase [Nocardioides faecalis]MBS4754074.1 quinone-dependent dihydroorotate dehydrogenase [Nocardioides faecalis]QVI60552.1 quinone-dependent dihydroorotate dehydrogenase [Nocardioides faecalis]